MSWKSNHKIYRGKLLKRNKKWVLLGNKAKTKNQGLKVSFDESKLTYEDMLVTAPLRTMHSLIIGVKKLIVILQNLRREGGGGTGSKIRFPLFFHSQIFHLRWNRYFLQNQDIFACALDIAS